VTRGSGWPGQLRMRIGWAVARGRPVRSLATVTYDAARLAQLRSGPHRQTMYAATGLPVTHSLAGFREAFASVSPGERRSDPVVLRGRVSAKREASRKLIFYTLEASNPAHGQRDYLQIMCDVRDCSPAMDPEAWFEVQPTSPGYVPFAHVSFRTGPLTGHTWGCGRSAWCSGGYQERRALCGGQ
jgi:hypothetical protein